MSEFVIPKRNPSAQPVDDVPIPRRYVVGESRVDVGGGVVVERGKASGV